MGMMSKMMNFFGFQDEEEMVDRNQDKSEEIETNPFENRKNKNNVVSINAQKNSRIILCEPRSYDETQEIADHLRSRRAVLVNLQRVRPDKAIRIVDFLSGTVYALSGSISRVGPNIFICTPESVEIQGGISEMLGNESE